MTNSVYFVPKAMNAFINTLAFITPWFTVFKPVLIFIDPSHVCILFTQVFILFLILNAHNIY